MATTLARIVGTRDGKLGKLGGIGIRFLVDGAESGGGFSLVEHPMEPRALAAPITIGSDCVALIKLCPAASRETEPNKMIAWLGVFLTWARIEFIVRLLR